MANATPSAPLPPSLAVNTTLKDRVKSSLVLLHAVPLCEAVLGVNCSVKDVGEVATPFFVHSEKSCGRVEAEAVGVLPEVTLGVLLGVTLGVKLGEGERVREPLGEGERVRVPLGVGVPVADATVATLRTPWFAWSTTYKFPAASPTTPSGEFAVAAPHAPLPCPMAPVNANGATT